MSYIHIKIKCIYLLSALFMSAALFSGALNNGVSGNSQSLLLPLVAVVTFITIGMIIFPVVKKMVVSMSFSGEYCLIKTNERLYKLSSSSITGIKKGISGFIRVTYNDGKRKRSFILRPGKAVHFVATSALDEMRVHFTNAVFSV